MISTCYDKSDALSHYELRVVSPAHIAILHSTLPERKLVKKKKVKDQYIIYKIQDVCQS